MPKSAQSHAVSAELSSCNFC